MKEFNLQEAKAGKPVCTRNGRPARIICFDAKCEHYPIVVLVEEENGKESLCNYSLDGRYNYTPQEENSYDLFMKSEKHKGWGWLSKSAQVYSTEKEALSHRPEFGHKVFLAKVEWEE